jgi:pyridoxine 4-dehydrogenase
MTPRLSGAAAQPSAAAAGSIAIGGHMVHRLGFGAMRLTGPGVWGPPRDRDIAISVARRAVELGVNFIDTADSYGPHVSEEIIAEALYPYPQDLVIATKGGLVRPGPGRWEPDGRPEHLRGACEGSLRRLRLERIALYQLHRIDPAVPADEQFGELAELQREGKIEHVGLSNVSVADIEHAQRTLRIVSVQNRYNLTDRASDDVIAYCQRHRIAFIPWFPLGAGSFNDPSSAVARLGARNDVTPMQLAIAWLLARSPIMLPIPGTSSIAHLEENIAAASQRLSDIDHVELDGAADQVAR